MNIPCKVIHAFAIWFIINQRNQERSKTIKSAFLGLITVFVWASAAPGRDWTDTQGRKISAEFLGLDASGVRVKLNSGKVAVLNKETLADGEWAIAEELAEKLDENASGNEQSIPVLLAKTVVASSDGNTSWMTSWGSYDKTVDQKRVVEIQVRSTSDTNRTVMLEAIWLTADEHGNVTGVMGVIRKEETLVARATQTVRVPMVYSSRDTKYAALGLHYKTGNNFGGWVMRVADPVSRKVIVVQASRPPLLKWSDVVPVL